MADTVASLQAEIATIEAALARTLALGASFGNPSGVSGSTHSLASLESLLRSRKVRLARLQAIEADRPPYAAQVL